MFRAVYAAASAHTTVSAPDGKTVKSDVFQIRRGVVQCDITSPFYFILALELIMRRHDAFPGKGVSLLSTVLHTLGYADDIALIDYGNPTGIQRAEARLNSITKGSRDDADMSVNCDKTKGMQIRSQDPVSKTTSEEAKKVCKYVCPHLNCGYRFFSKRGMKVHAGKCVWANEYEVERIIDSKGPTCARRFLIRWKGYSSDSDTWEPRSNVHPETIAEYEKENDCYDYDWEHRCPTCDLPFRSEHAVKIHLGRYHKPSRAQDFRHRLADAAVKR